MVPLVPFLRITISTQLTATEVNNRINCLLKADNAFRTKYYPEIKISSYDGDYRNTSIEMVRHTWYNNSFKPVIRGTVNTVNDSCSIELRLRLHLLVMIFVIFFLSITLIGGSVLAILSLSKNWGYAVLPLMMGLLMYSFMQIAFALECRVVQREMMRLFEPCTLVDNP